jgi:hypothetical protein
LEIAKEIEGSKSYFNSKLTRLIFIITVTLIDFVAIKKDGGIDTWSSYVDKVCSGLAIVYGVVKLHQAY